MEFYPFGILMEQWFLLRYMSERTVHTIKVPVCKNSGAFMYISNESVDTLHCSIGLK